MYIKLKGNYVINSDRYNVKLNKITNRKDKNGNTILNTIAYCGTVESALNSYLDRRIKGSDAESIPELLEDIKGIKKDINDALEGN